MPLHKTFKTLLFFVAASIVLAHVVLAYFSFPQADTFFSAVTARDYGAIYFAASSYFGWSGRWMPYLLLGAVSKPAIFPEYIHWAVIIIFFLFILSSFLVLSSFFNKSTAAPRLLPILDIAVILLSLPFSIKKESFYWSDTSIIYVMPLSVLFALLLLLNIKKRGPLALFGIKFLAFLAASFCEQFSLLLLGILGCIFLYHQYARLRLPATFWDVFTPMCFGGMLVIFAPGNFVRLSWFGDYIPGNQNIFYMAIDTLKYSFVYLAPFVGIMLAYGILRAAFFRPILADIPLVRKSGLWILPIVILCVVVSVFPAVYSYKGTYNIGGRIFFGAAIILVLTCLVMGDCLYKKTNKSISNPSLLLLAVIVSGACLNGMLDFVNAWNIAPTQKKIVMQQLTQMKEAAASDKDNVVLTNQDFQDNIMVYKRITDDETHDDYWINKAVAEHYGLKKVTLLPRR